MIPDEYKNLINKIIQVTENKKRQWEKTSDASKFTLDVGLNTITIQWYQSFPEEIPTVALEILNVYGERVDGIYITSPDYDYDKMFSLYGVARRSALKVEETIADIMNNLDD